MTGDERVSTRADAARSERRRRRRWEAMVELRLARLERVMWVMTGVGAATGMTAVYNLVTNVSQGGP